MRYPKFGINVTGNTQKRTFLVFCYRSCRRGSKHRKNNSTRGDIRALSPPRVATGLSAYPQHENMFSTSVQQTSSSCLPIHSTKTCFPPPLTKQTLQNCSNVSRGKEKNTCHFCRNVLCGIERKGYARFLFSFV